MCFCLNFNTDFSISLRNGITPLFIIVANTPLFIHMTFSLSVHLLTYEFPTASCLYFFFIILKLLLWLQFYQHIHLQEFEI
jgi:hypothetical protein